MISTEKYLNLPERHKLKEICKSISVIDAILSEDWLYRYYTYNSKWAEDEELGSMKNGEGDELLILFRNDGAEGVRGSLQLPTSTKKIQTTKKNFSVSSRRLLTTLHHLLFIEHYGQRG